MSPSPSPSPLTKYHPSHPHRSNPTSPRITPSLSQILRSPTNRKRFRPTQTKNLRGSKICSPLTDEERSSREYEDKKGSRLVVGELKGKAALRKAPSVLREVLDVSSKARIWLGADFSVLRRVLKSILTTIHLPLLNSSCCPTLLLSCCSCCRIPLPNRCCYSTTIQISVTL